MSSCPCTSAGTVIGSLPHLCRPRRRGHPRQIPPSPSTSSGIVMVVTASSTYSLSCSCSKFHPICLLWLPCQQRPVEGCRCVLGGPANLRVPLLGGTLRGGSLLLSVSLRCKLLPLSCLIGDPPLLDWQWPPLSFIRRPVPLNTSSPPPKAVERKCLAAKADAKKR